MAEDVAESTTPRWERLAKILNRVEPEQLAVERRRLIDDLIAGRKQYRCVEAIDGPVGSVEGARLTELPESYWRWSTIAWEWSTLTYAGRSFVRIEVLVDEPARAPGGPSDGAEATAGARPWITAEVKRMKAADELKAVERITDLARLLETHMRKCALSDTALHPVGMRHIKNHLRKWGLWPLSSVE